MWAATTYSLESARDDVMTCNLPVAPKPQHKGASRAPQPGYLVSRATNGREAVCRRSSGIPVRRLSGQVWNRTDGEASGPRTGSHAIVLSWNPRDRKNNKGASPGKSDVMASPSAYGAITRSARPSGDVLIYAESDLITPGA
ncbi:Hypp5825 [Branchiostoma lanceolatum]|uniref:Hypp5825 protein n=1 Tax=Branchiostoma lanceolatum TaxID=7740 RepID=A0A8J9YP07_BRALA|nr:Hypp5825 [Branchiostoma lanceolatum]